MKKEGGKGTEGMQTKWVCGTDTDTDTDTDADAAGPGDHGES